MRKLLILLGLVKAENPVTQYEASAHGYKDLYEEDQALYDLCRSYLLDYAQTWDDEAHKQEELKHILSFVRIPFKMPRDRAMKVLKRDFKRELNNVNTNLGEADGGYKIAVVHIANILLTFKEKSKKLRNS